MMDMKRAETKRTKPERAEPDMSLLRINATRTVAERVEAHDRALSVAVALRQAVRKLRHA